jgi:hypothetical protein
MPVKNEEVPKASERLAPSWSVSISAESPRSRSTGQVRAGCSSQDREDARIDNSTSLVLRAEQITE